MRENLEVARLPRDETKAHVLLLGHSIPKSLEWLSTSVLQTPLGEAPLRSLVQAVGRKRMFASPETPLKPTSYTDIRKGDHGE
jgi:hypothetical protein